MNLAHGPKVRTLGIKEDLSSIEAWKANVLYGLKQNPDFREFLEDGFDFGRKTNANPTRDLADIFKKEKVTQPDNSTKEMLVLYKSKQDRAGDVDLLLDQVANYCPYVPRPDITKDCRSMKEVWSTIRQFYGKGLSGASLNDVWNVRRELDEPPQVLYARMKQLYLDNLLTTDGLQHVDGKVLEDEEMSPTLLNTIVLHWLNTLHPNLRDVVTQRFITQLRDHTYASILPEISRSIVSLLDEVSNPVSVHRASYSNSPYRGSARPSYPPRQFSKPGNSFNYKPSNQPRPNSGKHCQFCKLTGKKMFYTHHIEDCLFIKRLNSQPSAVHQVSNEEDDWALQCQEFYEFTGEESEPPEFVINLVNGDASPVLELQSNNQECLVTLDTGAPCNLIKEVKAKELNATIRPTIQRVRMANGITPLDVVGETDVVLYRSNKPYHLPAIVCRDTDTDILAGIPIMKANDVAIHPFANEIILGGTEVVKYNPNGACGRNVKKLTLHSSSNQVVMPGQTVVFAVPNISGEVAVDPRWDSSHNKHTKETSYWPPAQVTKVVDGGVSLQNLSDDPVVIRKSEPVCNIKLAAHTTDDVLKVKTLSSTTPEKPQIQLEKKQSPYSDSVILNPDGIFTKEEENKFREALLTNDDVFAPVTSTYNGHSGPCYVQVNVGPNPPPQHKGRTPPFYGDDGLQELQEYFDDLQSRGILSRPEEIGVTVENINPSFLVNKPPPSTKKRLVTDFKSIKDYCRPSPSLLPNIEATIRRISRRKYEIKTDMTSSYWQIPMKKGSKKYCGVHTPYKGTLVYNVGSMGLPGVETALEELTCLVLGDMVKDGRVCKLADDLFIGGDTVDELLENFREVLFRFGKNNLKLSPTKTVIAPKSLEILGWVWSGGTLRASPHKLNALAACPQPATVSAMKSYLGAFRFISRVITGYASLLAPLEEAIKGKDPKEQVVWSEELSDAFRKSKDALSSHKTITVPCPSDRLSIVTDASVRPGAVGATLYVLRENKKLLGGFYNSKLPNFQKRWLPCELEAIAISLALHHFAPYIIQSAHKPQILTDSKPCVDAANKLKRGEFSMSARLSTFISTTSRYNADVSHIPGSANLLSDFASRNPVECPSPSTCAVCRFVAEEVNSVVQHVTVEDILGGKAKIPWTNRGAWKDIQEECSELRKVKFFRGKGTQPGKKSRHLRQVRRYMSSGTILAHDGLLINPCSPPLGPVLERIVVPNQMLHGLLTMLHLNLNHPTAYQLSKAFARHFFALDSDKCIKQVSQACSQCAAIKELPKAMIPESTEPPPSVIGGRFAADVIKRCSQKILCIRETVTSYTLAELIPDERGETIANTLAKHCNLLRPSSASPINIRVDPATANQSLVAALQGSHSNNILSKNNIQLELGRTLNKNKNCVIDKGIRELIRELLIIQPEGGPVSSLMLSQAVANLNSRYRSSGMSAQELWTKRDQVTGNPLPVEDREVIMSQYRTRLRNHPKSEKCKSHGKPPHPSAAVDVGSLVFVYTDRNKLQARKRYLVTHMDGDKVKLRRFTEHLLGNKEYDSNLQEIYKVPSLDDKYLPSDDNDSSDDEPRAVTTKEKSVQLQEYIPSSDNVFEQDITSDDDNESHVGDDTGGSQEDDSEGDGDDERDETFRAPANTRVPLTPRIRERRATKSIDRYGI